MERLIAIQQELKATKDLYNGYGGYNYRSCESILEALKPLLLKHKLAIVIQDDLLNIGERYYVKAIVRLIDENKDVIVETTAFAREEETKKGMDGSQITGASSSYARKYALNGMFAIDDAKDSDNTNKHGKDEVQASSNDIAGKINSINDIKELIKFFNANQKVINADKELFKQFKAKRETLAGGNNE